MAKQSGMGSRIIHLGPPGSRLFPTEKIPTSCALANYRNNTTGSPQKGFKLKGTDWFLGKTHDLERRKPMTRKSDASVRRKHAGILKAMGGS